MIFERKIYDVLLDWKNENRTRQADKKTAVLIEGARRVGKTTVVKNFAEREYRSYILVDFSYRHEKIRSCLENGIEDIDVFFSVLSSDADHRDALYPLESAIVFDEVQDCPEARECLGKLVADGRYDFIVTGSLISVGKTAAHVSLSGVEKTLRMYPMSFDEFCLALGEEEMVEDIRVSFNRRRPVEERQHRAAMRLFREYMFVGGMPQAVEAFIDVGRDTKNLKCVDSTKREIVDLYRHDLVKLDPEGAIGLVSVFDLIPELLSKHEQNTGIYGEAFDCFKQAMICNICKRDDNPAGVDSGSSTDSKYEKCYMGDTGLFQCLRFTEPAVLNNDLFSRMVGDRLHANNGIAYENAVSQMLVSAGHENLRFFSRHKTDGKKECDAGEHDIEIDFLISRSDNQNIRTCPIEVKSENGYETKSLIRFKEKYTKHIGMGFVVLPANLRYDVDNDILNIPPYMVFCVNAIIIVDQVLA